jgi:DNA-binding NarL/FixJ family response regulator
MNTRRTAIVLDRYPLWFEAVIRLLGRVEIDVVATATTAEEALRLVRQHRPDLLIAEIRVSNDGATTFDYLRTARAESPELKLIVLSDSDNPDDIDQSLAAGASAYVIKSAHPDDLASAIRQAFECSIYFATTVSAAGREASDPTPSAPRLEEVQTDHGLTRRELEILRLVAEGYSNGELARMLWVTEQTIKFHLSNIYRKLDVSNRTEASRWAQLNNLLSAVENEAVTA